MNEEDMLFKGSRKREFTSDSKNWYEENLSLPNSIRFTSVWLDDLPKDPPTESTDTISIIDLTLTENYSVEDHTAWYVCSTPGVLNTRIYDFIQPDKNLSNKYNVKVYDNDGRQILVDEIEWVFDYDNGLLVFERDPSQEYSLPFRLFGYRYTGEKAKKTSLGAQNLDEAYDGKEGRGAGAKIQVDSGPVVLEASNGSPSLKITPVDYYPDEEYVSGSEIVNYNGILYIYDASREAWVSLDRQTVSFGAKRADGVYLNLSNFSSNMSGWPALRDGIILGITAQASGGDPNKKMKIILHGYNQPAFQFNLNNLYYANGDLDIKFSQNDLIKILATSELGTVYNLIINLEIAWRLVKV